MAAVAHGGSSLARYNSAAVVRHRLPPAINEVEGPSEPELLRHLPCGGRPRPLAATRYPPDEHVVQRREDPLRRRATVDVHHGRRAAIVDGSEDVLVLRDDQADATMEDVPRVHVRSGEGSQDRTLAVDHVHEFRLGMSFGAIVVVVHRCEQSSHAYVVVVVEVGQTQLLASLPIRQRQRDV